MTPTRAPFYSQYTNLFFCLRVGYESFSFRRLFARVFPRCFSGVFPAVYLSCFFCVVYWLFLFSCVVCRVCVHSYSFSFSCVCRVVIRVCFVVVFLRVSCVCCIRGGILSFHIRVCVIPACPFLPLRAHWSSP